MKVVFRARRRELEPPQTLLGGLVDLNSAPASDIARLPGLDAELAAMIVVLREHMDGFTSRAQLAAMLDLPRDVVSDLADCTVVLPRCG